MKKWLIGLLVVAAAVLGIGWLAIDKDMRALAANLPTNRNVLFWTIPERDAAFRAMDRLPVLAQANVIRTGDWVYPMPKGADLKLDTDVDAYMKAQRMAGLVIVQDGKIRLEKYGLDFDANGKWTSFSVAKSFTSTMVGVAIKDGYIGSLDDKVSQYLTEMKGSAYDDVTIAQLLTMTSGVKWNEDYEDPNSDVARFNEHKAEPGVDVTVSYMRKLPREAPAGTKWVYKTGETNLIGVLVSRATGKTLSDYLSARVWAPFGMEQDASWLLGSTGHEISGCCVQASTRDFARFGLFMLGGGKIKGESILPDSWIEAATTKRADIGEPGHGYGFQWWTYDDGSYAAQGIFGQGIFIDPKRKLVIASNSNWPRATDPAGQDGREAFYKVVQKAIDAEASAKQGKSK
ncbi:serine hydrolase domain-containing protein [Sphingorhabdus buctiana]|uniref:Serine hydrolase domain-containing protein n=1 Tax=Sphingorhabdus buctiana TaxID=1508805 RepID=A0ABW4MDJ1_9SPHN